MDAYGHVNNTVQFRYFESARVEYLAKCGFLRSWEEDRIGAILHSTGCCFRRPLFHPDYGARRRCPIPEAVAASIRALEVWA
jgi:acyl-CoA thioester hydrolase